MSRGGLALLATALLLPGGLTGQTLAAGRWTGTVTFPDADSTMLTVLVERTNRQLAIDFATATGLSWGLGDLHEWPGRLDFTWAMDRPQPFRCRLTARSETRWEGACDDTVRGADGKLMRLLISLERPPQRSGTANHTSR